METKSEWKGVGEGRPENACYFWDSGGTGSVVSRVIYRHLTIIKGTCQASRYWIPLPSMVSPYLYYVLITTPLFTIRGALSLPHWLFFSLPALYSTNAMSLDRPISNYRYCPTVFTRLCFHHFFQSPPSPSNDGLSRTLGIQGSLDGPWNLPHCNQPTCNQVTNNMTGGYFQRYLTMEPAVPKMGCWFDLSWRPLGM